MNDEVPIDTVVEDHSRVGEPSLHSPRDTTRKDFGSNRVNKEKTGYIIIPDRTRVAAIYEELIFEYAALGSNPLEIAKALKMPKKTILKVLALPYAAACIRKKMDAGPIARAKAFIHDNFLKAIMKQRHLMDNAKNEDVQRKAADSVIALAIGKSGASLFDNQQDIEKLSREQTVEKLRELVAKSENATGN